MILVDTHVHVGLYWYEPVETLLFEMQRNGVAKAVLIQFGGNYDNRYEIECIHNYPGRLAAVVLVDTQKADAADTLERWTKEGAVGVRLRADWRSPGTDPLAIWHKTSPFQDGASSRRKVAVIGRLREPLASKKTCQCSYDFSTLILSKN